VGSVEEAVRTCGPGRSSQAKAEAERRWQGRNRRCIEEALGGEGGGSEGGGQAGTRRQESCEESAGEGFTEGHEEGCREATAENRRTSGCCPGGNRVAMRSRRDAPLAQRGCDRFRVKSQEGKELGAF
jgi:hypothetical protein